MPLREVVDLAEESVEPAGLPVVVGEVAPQEASAVLRLLAELLPLERFGLAHLVRDDSAGPSRLTADSEASAEGAAT